MAGVFFAEGSKSNKLERKFMSNKKKKDFKTCGLSYISTTQPSTTEEHINHLSTLEAISHWVDAFVCGCNTHRCTHIMHLRPHLIFLCLEWPEWWNWVTPALLKDMCRQKTWRLNLSKSTTPPAWIKGCSSINEMVASQFCFDKTNMFDTKRHPDPETAEREKLREEEKNSDRGRNMQ